LSDNTDIRCGDGFALIKEHIDNPTAFIFIDPPYEKSRGLYHYHGCDFAALAALLKNARCSFLLTINDSPAIREYFSSLTLLKEITVSSCGHGIPPRKELWYKGGLSR
jgi:site-specific DNA-adenine methylase